jgi:hypothetical protein
MTSPRTGLSALIISVLLVFGINIAKAQGFVPANGRVLFDEVPLCALVLINGQSQFSCAGDGRFDLDVPLDGNGMVTVQVFASGFAPSRSLLAPEQVTNYQVDMSRISKGRTFEVDTTYSNLGTEGWAWITGTVQAAGEPVCALILANGQKMFSCKADLGQFALEVPRDQDGNVTLQIFADGFSPYRVILRGGDPEKPNNLTAVSLENESPDPRIGYPLKLTLTMDAVEFIRDVGVAFYVFDKDQPELRQYSLGASTLKEVNPGSNVFEFEFDVPTEIEFPGAYYIGASVDATEVIAETDEDDNETSLELTLSAKQRPNLFIEFMEPDRKAIVLDRTAWDYEEQISANGEIVSDAGGTVTFGLKGAERPIDVEAFATLKLIRSAGPAGPIIPFAITQSGDFLEVPLYLWDSNANPNRYTHAYGIDPVQGIDTGVEEWLSIGRVGQLELSSSSVFDIRSAHLDYYFPGRLAEEIEIALRKLPVFLGGPIEPPPDLSAADIQALRSFLFGADLEDVTSELCLRIRPADASVIEDRTDDNEICSPLQLLLPPVEVDPPPPPPPLPVPPIYTVPSEPIFFDAMYRAGWPGNYFGASLDFSASSSANTKGAVVAGRTEIPVTLFGSTFQFLGIEARAQVLPLSDRFASEEAREQLEPGFTLNVSVLNQIIFFRNDPPEGSFEVSVSWSIETPEYLDALPKTPVGNKPPPAPIDKKKPPRPPFYGFIGPVPVEYRPQVSGNIGVEGEVNFGSPTLEALSYEVGPFASAEVDVEVRSKIVPFVRAEGVVNLLKAAQPHKSIFSINVLDDRHADGTSEIVFVDQFLVENSIEGLSGELNAFVEVSGGKSCKKWGWFKFICNALPDIKYTVSLLEWDPFLKINKTLKDERRVIDIITRPDKSVNYYQER